MARSSSSKSPKKHRNSSSSSVVVKGSAEKLGNEKKTGPEDEDALRTKAMHEVHDIPGLSFKDEENPEDNIQWVTQRNKKNGKNSVAGETTDKSNEKPEQDTEELLQFTAEDVREEIAYWNQAVFCFVLGANPPWEVVQGYVHRIWGKHGIDKISFLPNGIFLVRFKEMKDKEAILNAGYHMFDNKPLIVKPWQEKIDLLKARVKVVPDGFAYMDYPLNSGILSPRHCRINWPLCKVRRCHKVEKTRLGFARTMVELKIGQALKPTIKFRDEKGQILQLKVEYEWKPIVCEKCSERLSLWENLRKFATPSTPWAIAGDFNTVISPDERLGAATKQEDMETFVDCISDCGMTDIHATGAYFTWNNKQDHNHRKYSKIDRFLINNEWLDAFPDMNAHFHPEGIMDHTPCVIRNTKLDGRRKSSFKYLNMWSTAPDFLKTVKHIWSLQIHGSKMFGLVKKLKALKGDLRDLNQKCFSDVELRASQAINTLEEIQLQIEEHYDSNDLITREIQALQEVNYWTKARESFLQQKAKVHQKRTEHVRRAVLQTGPVCNANHTTALLAPITKDEIKRVVFAIPKDKAPGPDGYTSGFFKDSWDIVGEDVCSAIMEFFNSGRMLTQVNATSITLIPKCDRPTNVSHFRPIACCNMGYKVISKLLCNRLALVLLDIIHENQGAFVKGRSIIENVLICQDIVHLYARKAVTPRCLFKIDLQKAYDTIEWEFIEQMLHGLNFPQHFIQLVMQCVTTPTYTLSLNGSNFGYFKGQRGLRQGDPISPLLFTICMEYLTRLINFATTRWPFQYHPLCKNLKLTHLMFADDLLLFCKGKPQSIWLLMRAFSSFSKASGLALNNAKSEIFFNGVEEDIKEGIKLVTGFREGKMPFTYLGVPIKAGRLTKHECNALTEKMVTRIRSLGAKKLSYAGRVTLINSVLNTLQNYWAQMFIIPKSIINHIMAICRNYLWDGSTVYQRVPMVAWDKVTLPKKEGGLGIKRADTWNYATVGKLVDWIYSKADRLWIKWVSNVYIKDQDWHDYSPPADATWVWKSICKVKEKLKNGFEDGKWTVNPKGYTIRNGYEWLSPVHVPLEWPAIVWNNWNVPKHSMTTWLRMHEGMNVKSKLVRFGCSQWFGGCFPTVNSLIATKRDSAGWKVKAAIFNAFTYSVWYQRNNARVNECLVRPEIVAARIEEEVRKRVKGKCGLDADGIRSLNTRVVL
ncbi:uncharacterized protein LOC141607666 [Silene latifolia]|uniref:uncharacterized protein LOC141607666 n=1 Tax=Silene latifolia TaxID=37657 RepID=UPI003D77B6F0